MGVIGQNELVVIAMSLVQYWVIGQNELVIIVMSLVKDWAH